MAGLFGLGSHNARPIIFTSIQAQTSAQGVTVPVYYGTNRGAPNLLWYSGFRATQVSSGGKGGIVGAAGKGGGNQYKYSANVILGMGEGPIQDFGQAWSSKTPTTVAALGLTAFDGTYPQSIWAFVTANYPSDGRPYTGLAYLAGANYQLGSMAELPAHTFEVYGFFSRRTVYVATSVPSGGPFRVTVGNRAWANGSTVNLWVSDVSVVSGATTFTKVGGAPALNQYSAVAGVYTFNSGNAAASITIAFNADGQDADPSLVVNDILTNVDYGVGLGSSQVGEVNAYSEDHAIPGSPFQVNVTHASGFDENLSVYHAASDTLFTCVSGSPAALQYSVSAGVYTFNTADSGKTVSIAYAANVGLTTYQSYCWAAGLFVSPIYRSQTSASNALDELANYTNSEIVFTSGALKLVPRGDASLTGNGYTYTPLNTVQETLTDDLFQNTNANSGGASGNAADPVIATRKRIADQKNVVQIEVLDRGNQYNSAMVESTDQAAVDLFGRRTTGSQSAHLFCDTTIGRQSAQLLLQRQALHNTYAFTLDARYVWLDPMDIVTLTDANLGLSATQVRILSIEEQEDGPLAITAEEYPGVVGSAQAYSFGAGAGYAANYNVDPGSINTPILFETSVQLAGNSGLEMWGAFSGANSNWGGCDIFVSSDGVTYNFVGRKWGASRMGVLTGTTSAALGYLSANDASRVQRTRIGGDFNTVGKVPAAGVSLPSMVWPNLFIRSHALASMGWGTGAIFNKASDPDTVDTIAVDLTESFGALISGTNADADAGNTLCIVDSELFSYSLATLTATYKYSLSNYIRRGQFGTAIAPHSAGALFARLDDNIFAIPYDKNQVGKTVYVKACSFNLWGGGLQDLSVATAYPHTIIGPPVAGTILNFTAQQSGLTVVLSWTDLTDPSIKGYDIFYGAQGGSIASATLLSQASRTTETTTAAVGPGSWTFYIRTRNIADQTGPVSSVNATISAFSQQFDASGTWSKPSGITNTSRTHVECWGAGGGGGSGTPGGGGGGGSYLDAWFNTADLSATVAVTIGAGGPVDTVGGNSSFATLLTAYGGGRGGTGVNNSGGGGGGGALSVGSSGTIAGGNGGTPGGGTGAPNNSSNPGGDSSFGGGGGGAVTLSAVGSNAGNSVYGGGGGAGYNTTAGDGLGGYSIYGGGGGSAGGGSANGGTSTFGGVGGGPNTAGTAPGGGGGGATAGSGGAAGAAGRVRVTVIP